jgi:putative tricarboxylic transport membrane protein
LRANDILSGLVLIAFAIAMIALTLTFPDFPGQKYGPSLFPRILGAGLILCGTVLVRNGLVARRTAQVPGQVPWLELAAWMRDPWRLTSFLLTLVLLLIYILASETIGFIPLALLFLLTLFLWLGVRLVPAVVTAVATTIAIHWFFSTLLRVPLPRGMLDPIL